MNSINPVHWGITAANSTHEDSWTEFHTYLQTLGFEQSALVFDQSPSDAGHPKKGLYGTIVSDEFQDYVRSSDPYIDFGVPSASLSGRNLRVAPGELMKSPGLAREHRQFYGDTLDLGLRGGWTMSVPERVNRRFSVLLISSSDNEDDFFRLIDSKIGIVTQATIYLHEGLFIQRLRERYPGGVNLTSRQRDCLAWSGAGKSSKEIGDLLSIAESTVNEYLADAARKLEAGNRSQAVARAMLLGLTAP